MNKLKPWMTTLRCAAPIVIPPAFRRDARVSRSGRKAPSRHRPVVRRRIGRAIERHTGLMELRMSISRIVFQVINCAA